MPGKKNRTIWRLVLETHLQSFEEEGKAQTARDLSSWWKACAASSITKKHSREGSGSSEECVGRPTAWLESHRIALSQTMRLLEAAGMPVDFIHCLSLLCVVGT